MRGPFKCKLQDHPKQTHPMLNMVLRSSTRGLLIASALLFLDSSSAFAPGALLRGDVHNIGRHHLPATAKRQSLRTAPKAQAEIFDGVNTAFQTLQTLASSGMVIADAAAGAAKESSTFTPSYSANSYYASLGLYVLSFPGLWSLVKRSVDYKPIKKVYTTEGPTKGKEVRQTAAEITAYFKAMNFSPEPAADTITFRGTMGRSVGQAMYLTFCTFLGLASLAIVLTVTAPLTDDPSKFQEWYYLTLASPYAGIYYWQKASKDVTVQLKIEESEDGEEVDISALGTKEELERFCETMQFGEKGKIRVPGIVETLGALKD